MKTDILKQYLTFQDALKKERAQLEQRLEQIKQVLAGKDSALAARLAAPVARPARRGAGLVRKAGKKPVKPIRNKMSLREAVIQVTKDKPLTKQEILAAIHKLGYRFATKNPLNTLSVVLYSKKQFKNQNGKFSPGKV
jgi:hypothetical protein